MAVNITKTEKFTNPTSSISFSQIRSAFGGNSTNVRAATYRRNTSDQVDWNGENAAYIEPKIPDAKENENVTTSNNWTVSTLRNSITDYVVTQSGTNEELSYSSGDISTWNGNLSRNVLKRFNVNGTIYANEVSKDAMSFNGNLYNLEIEVSAAGEILGEGGSAPGGNGGDALYVNNTYSKSDVKVRSYGKIYSGGGGGSPGNSGNSGPSLSCSSTSNFSTGNPFQSGRNLGDAAPGQSCSSARSGANWVSANQNSVRNRCRGGGTRRGSGEYPSGNYQCSPTWTITCQETNYFNLSGGAGGTGGAGGRGRGYSYQSGSLAGTSGNSGNTNSCSGGSSKGNDGNDGNSGGDWGQTIVGGGTAGAAIKKRNTRVEYYTQNTLKGPIQNV